MKIPTERLNKTGFGESNREVIAVAGRYLKIKTISGPLEKL
jgi:hypothetical protein